MEWVNPKTIIGPAAEGEKYLKRPEINKLFWHCILNGEHILFTAPRRVGKSSVMKDLEKTAPDGILAIYQNVEADKSSQEFYKRLWTLIVNQLNAKNRWQAKIGEWLKKRKIGEISVEGSVKFEAAELNFKHEMLELIEELSRETDTIVVLMLDEFPDTVNNIRKAEGDLEAIDLLHVMRAIRHEAKFKSFRLVLAGSIGLEHVIVSMDRIKLINDLKRIPVETLTENEVNSLFELILNGATMQIGEAERAYMKEKVEHRLPYFFQLMIAKCNDLAYKAENPIITTEIIDVAFKTILTEHEHFSDWEQRLKDYLSETDFTYCIGLLTRCAHRSVTIQEAFNYAKIAPPATGYKSLIDDVLVRDGYLVHTNGQLKFLSPFLQAWWKSRHPEFEIED